MHQRAGKLNNQDIEIKDQFAIQSAPRQSMKQTRRPVSGKPPIVGKRSTSSNERESQKYMKVQKSTLPTIASTRSLQARPKLVSYNKSEARGFKMRQGNNSTADASRTVREATTFNNKKPLNLKRRTNRVDESQNFEEKNVLQMCDGNEMTVKDFIADAEMIKQGKRPDKIRIGIAFTTYQKFKDEEAAVQKEKDKNQNFKNDVLTAKRIAGDLRNQKKR